MLAAFKRAPIVIGSRRARGADIRVHQPIIRETSGRVFTFLSTKLFGLGVLDVTCGFKGFRRDVARKLFTDLSVQRWVFDTEILLRARQKKIAIYELPVRWANRRGSKVRGIDIVGSVIDLIRLWWYKR
jgi:hypothetical protein